MTLGEEAKKRALKAQEESQASRENSLGRAVAVLVKQVEELGTNLTMLVEEASLQGKFSVTVPLRGENNAHGITAEALSGAIPAIAKLKYIVESEGMRFDTQSKKIIGNLVEASVKIDWS